MKELASEATSTFHQANEGRRLATVPGHEPRASITSLNGLDTLTSLSSLASFASLNSLTNLASLNNLANLSGLANQSR